MNHRPEQMLDMDRIEHSDVNRAIGPENKGFQLLVKMGWKGAGLGRAEQGVCTLNPVQCRIVVGS